MNSFIIVRILDVLTTLWGINHGQYEFNPTQNGLLDRGALYFVAWNALIIWIVYQLYHFKLIRITVNIFTVLSALVVLNNIFLIVMVYFMGRGAY